MTGDTYNNSGNNFGHMGPIHIGRQVFQFTPQIGNEILAKIPKNGPIKIEIVGSKRAVMVGNEILAFLRSNGFEIGEVKYIGMIAPPPSGPLTFDRNTLTIAADL